MHIGHAVYSASYSYGFFRKLILIVKKTARAAYVKITPLLLNDNLIRDKNSHLFSLLCPNPGNKLGFLAWL